MKGSNIISGVHSLKQAFEFFADFQREHPGTKGENLFKDYNRRLNWIVNDLITHPLLPETVREGIKNEWSSDAFTVDAITEKTALLSPEQREGLEYILDEMLKGETLKVEHIKE